MQCEHQDSIKYIGDLIIDGCVRCFYGRNILCMCELVYASFRDSEFIPLFDRFIFKIIYHFYHDVQWLTKVPAYLCMCSYAQKNTPK